MSTSLTLDTARADDGSLVLTAAGEVDLSNIDDFDRALAAATDEAVRCGETLVVDLRWLEYLDSTAINALFARGDHITVVAPQLLMSTLAMSGLTELVTVQSAPPAS